MKKLLFLLLLTSGMFACKQAPESDEAMVTPAREEAKEKGSSYQVDLASSRIEWIGTKVSGYHSGSVALKSGELNVSSGNVTAGRFTMDMTTIKATGPDRVPEDANKKLTGHLHSPDFFDVKQFPDARFVITSVKPFAGTQAEESDERQELSRYKVTNPTHLVSGNLSIKGIEKNVEFPAEITVSDNAVEARARFNIDRRQWDIEYAGQPDDLIRHDIHLGILLRAVR